MAERRGERARKHGRGAHATCLSEQSAAPDKGKERKQVRGKGDTNLAAYGGLEADWPTGSSRGKNNCVRFSR